MVTQVPMPGQIRHHLATGAPCDTTEGAGTNIARGTCHGGRPSFPPPPVLGRSMLGAVDMPIGCALTFPQGERHGQRKAATRAKRDAWRVGWGANWSAYRTTASPGARWACARAGAPCGRRITPG